MKYTLADDVEFTLGMTIYFPTGEPYQTSPEIHQVTVWDGPIRWKPLQMLSRKGVPFYTELNHFYSSFENAVQSQIDKNNQEIKRLQAENQALEQVKKNGKYDA